ncbi:hypothetical protein H4582DRAFT_2126197 [Lactarius indigo]|nr:hypothetical protein H4582DRAFT_2126197 [Lactarius indigo]
MTMPPRCLKAPSLQMLLPEDWFTHHCEDCVVHRRERHCKEPNEGMTLKLVFEACHLGKRKRRISGQIPEAFTWSVVASMTCKLYISQFALGTKDIVALDEQAKAAVEERSAGSYQTCWKILFDE